MFVDQFNAHWIDADARLGMPGVNRTAANIWPVRRLIVRLSATMPTGMGVRRNFSIGGATSTFCLSFSGC